MPSSINQRRHLWTLHKRDAGLCDDTHSPPIRSASDSVSGGRDYNEDRCYRCDDSQFYLVVDGMGGHRGGALASQIAVETVPALWRDEQDRKLHSEEEIQAAFRDSVSGATREMSAAAESHHEYDRMGCTLGFATVVGKRLYFGSVGDCRVYLLRRKKLVRLTKDQTLVQGLVDAGVLKAAEAKTHRWRHIVTNSVSAQGMQAPPVLKSTAIVPGDVVLITSDGMPDELSDDEIKQIMVRCSNPQQCVDQLVAEALRRDARDNVTCVVIQI